MIISLIYTAHWMNEQIGETLKDFDLSTPQFNVLRILRGQKGKPANLSTIQERMVSKMSNTTRLVDKLIAKKLVERVTCEKNRRKVEITITRKGLDILNEVDPEMDRVEAKIAENLNPSEVAELTEMLQRLRE
jgi:DNA-binding MarR family transcriptional regulator